jgi:hypothetical protein
LDLLSIAKEQNKEQKEITQQRQGPLYSFMYALKSSEANILEIYFHKKGL